VCTQGDSAKHSETRCKDDTAEVKITFCELNYTFMAFKNILKMDQTSSCRNKTNGRIEIILEQIRSFETENSNIQSVPGVNSTSFTFLNIQKWPSRNQKSLTGTHNTVKCHCNERQYNEMFRVAKLFLGPFPFPYLMCVKTFHFNEFTTFSIMN